MQTLSIREQQKRDRKERIFGAAMQLFEEHGFQETTVIDIAKAARVSRGTVFNYFPYKEAILIEHLAQKLANMRERVQANAVSKSPVDSLYEVFHELAGFSEAQKQLILPLSYELLNPDPERSKNAFVSLPLVPFLAELLGQAKATGLVRSDFSRERLARTIANTFFLTALQWAAYRQDISIQDELKVALRLTLEGIVVKN